MARFNKIVLAVDGTGICTKTVHNLLELRCFVRPEITILHAVPPQITADQMHLYQERGKEILAQSQAALALKPEVKITTELVEGDPKVVVLERAEQLQADLIVMGSRSRSRLEAILQNSVSQYVFQVAKCAMLLVKDGVPIRPIERVMVAIDGSPASQSALEAGIELMRDLKDRPIYLARVQSSETPIAEDKPLSEAIAYVRRLGIPYKTAVTVGDPGVGLCQLALDERIDLLVMGSPDRRPTIARSLPDLDRLLGKSTSDYVRVHIECPVLMVRPVQN
ncbi:MAG: universal stress protein [Thermostichales cyanobacterium BF4_bins_65]